MRVRGSSWPARPALSRLGLGGLRRGEVRRGEVLRDVGLWAGFALLVTLENNSFEGGRTPWPPIIAGLVVLLAAVVIGRPRPVLGLGIAITLYVAQIATLPQDYGPFPVSGFLVLGVLSYLAGVRTPRARPVALLFTGAAVLFMPLAMVSLGTLIGFLNWLISVLVALFGMVAPWLIGRYRRQQLALVQAGWERAERLEREQLIVVERERLREQARIARDMHDSLGHELSLIALRAGALELDPSLDEPHRRSAGELRRAAGSATERLGEIIGMLRAGSETATPATPPWPPGSAHGGPGAGSARGASGAGPAHGGSGAASVTAGPAGSADEGGVPLVPARESVADLVERVRASGMDVRLEERGQAAQAEQPEQAGQAERGDRAEQAEQGGQAERGERDGRAGQAGRGDRAEQGERDERAGQAGRDGAATPPLAAQAVHRVVREALTNAAKHAPGASVTVRVTREATETVVDVVNTAPPGATRHASAPSGLGIVEREARPAGREVAPSGPGSVEREARPAGREVAPSGPGSVEREARPAGREVAPSGPGSVERGTRPTGREVAPGGGFGLVGLRERVRLAGGTFVAEPRDGGFAVQARVPDAAPPGPAEVEVAPTGGGETESQRRLRDARQRVRNGLLVAVAVPTGLAAAIGAVGLGYYLLNSYLSVLTPAAFAELRIGASQQAVEDVLPVVETVDPPERRGTFPPGATCRHYRSEATPFALETVYRVCFADGRLVAKYVIATGSVETEETAPRTGSGEAE